MNGVRTQIFNTIVSLVFQIKLNMDSEVAKYVNVSFSRSEMRKHFDIDSLEQISFKTLQGI